MPWPRCTRCVSYLCAVSSCLFFESVVFVSCPGVVCPVRLVRFVSCSCHVHVSHLCVLSSCRASCLPSSCGVLVSCVVSCSCVVSHLCVLSSCLIVVSVVVVPCPPVVCRVCCVCVVSRVMPWGCLVSCPLSSCRVLESFHIFVPILVSSCRVVVFVSNLPCRRL